MNFSQAISSCLSKYSTFKGRAPRSEFWWFYLFTVLVSWGSSLVSGMMALTQPDFAAIATIGPNIVSLIFFLPILAASSRRLHDTNRSGWWFLLIFTIIGIIPLVIWWASDSSKEANKYA
jgi:uncharacterized membrane protein YhaH (DUF805 family)